MDKYSDILWFEDGDLQKLENGFVEFQLLDDDEIPPIVWEKARIRKQPEEMSSVYEEPSYHFRMDTVWHFLAKLKTADGCQDRFKRIARVAHLVMTIPHSNASEERVFSLIKLNKTDCRNSLNLHRTMSNLLTIKTADLGPSHLFKPSKNMLAKAKKATWEYNKNHVGKLQDQSKK